MAYKDKDKQKQANKDRQKRYRNAHKSVTPLGDVTPKNVTPVTPSIVTPNVTPCNALPANYGSPDCQCMMCQINGRAANKSIINHGKPKGFDELAPNELNRQTLPGDVDYVGFFTERKQ